MLVPLYLCLNVRDFAAQTLVRLRPEWRQRPIAILDGNPPLKTVFALNQRARSLGLELGMGRLQAESFDRVSVSSRQKQEEETSFLILMQCAERFSPRIEVLSSPGESTSGAIFILDVSASERLFGTPEQIAGALRRDVDAAGFEPSIAISCNAYAAVLAARGFRGTTVIPSGNEAHVLAPLPVAVLELEPEQEDSFLSWGIKTLGALAALPQKALIARIGQTGYRLQTLARGAYQHLLVPAEPPVDSVLSESAELEHPVDLLEPLLFLLSRMLEQILVRAAEHALAIACVETRLVLDRASGREHRRVVRPALPECNHPTLLKLIQLDLEIHPPKGAVVALHIQAQPARPQTVQQGLFVPQTPEAGRLEVLLARLRKLVGEDRVGTPELLDSHRPDAFRMASFLPNGSATPRFSTTGISISALRMLRPPRTVRVKMQHSQMVALSLDGRKLPIHKASGPWKASGAWWTHAEWCREEWDVALNVALDVRLGEHKKLYCRIAYDPGARCWYMTGIYD
jgi:protein ImuB